MTTMDTDNLDTELPRDEHVSLPLPLPDVPQEKRRGGGPKTPEGRDRARRNALKHGMMARVVFPEELDIAIARRTDELKREFSPATPYEEQLVVEMARATAKLDYNHAQGLV